MSPGDIGVELTEHALIKSDQDTYAELQAMHEEEMSKIETAPNIDVTDEPKIFVAHTSDSLQITRDRLIADLREEGVSFVDEVHSVLLSVHLSLLQV